MAVSYYKILLFLMLIATTYASFALRRPRTHNGFNKIMNITKSIDTVRNRTKTRLVFHDMPTKNDLIGYLKSLQRIIDFSAANKNDIDINFAFGLFLINVNLKSVIRHRHMNIPLLMLQPIRLLVKKNTELLNFFRDMVKQDKTPGNKLSKAIYSLFSNDTVWVERLDRYDAVFKTDKSRTTFEQLQAIYKTWEQYTKRIYDWEKRAVPGPRQSDHCVSALSESAMDVMNYKPQCILPMECYEVLEKGSNSGYALTHRLLLMILARYGRGCSIFSPSKDREVTGLYCTAAYAEAQYIAMHQFGVIDLLMEQISFCTLDGHIEFLKRAWLFNAMKRQTTYGCFAETEGMKRSHHTPARARAWMLAKAPEEQNIQGGLCNGHLTSTAGAALASAVRFIVATTKFPQ